MKAGIVKDGQTGAIDLNSGKNLLFVFRYFLPSDIKIYQNLNLSQNYQLGLQKLHIILVSIICRRKKYLFMMI